MQQPSRHPGQLLLHLVQQSGFNCVMEAAMKYKWFKVELFEYKKFKHNLNKSKLIPVINFPFFASINEQQFEDWVHSIASIVNRRRLEIRFFKEM